MTARTKKTAKTVQKLTPEELRVKRAIIARENGKKGGRPPGVIEVVPRNTAKVLAQMKFRVKKELQDNEDACDLAGTALQRQYDVMMGKVHSRRSPSVLKAAMTIRAEICEPLVQEVKHSGGISLVAAVAEASKQLEGAAEQVVTTTATPVDPPVEDIPLPTEPGKE